MELDKKSGGINSAGLNNISCQHPSLAGCITEDVPGNKIDYCGIKSGGFGTRPYG